jgi:2-polyprenyl-3-methyl-5-hydroxy-6-metoxy-1,4-benzoquinol methylase
MINFLLKNPSIYRFYQKTVRAKYNEYDFFRFIFKQNNFKNMRMLDICCGDSYILEYINEFIDDYLGIDNNDKYLKQCQKRWKKFNFIQLDLDDKANIDQLIEFKPNFIFINGAIHHLDNKTVKSINNFIKNNFSDCYFLSVDPIKNNNSFFNSIMIMLDRGKFIRNKLEYAELMDSFNSFIVDDFYRMKFENIFHYKNFDLKEFYHNWKKEIF